ncbi:hypothetical protein BC831DRAFT_435658 [Entophlyctis helioformis]|nr:hypothetical protein BC831DRAFT_435658 [Entophlyctis helioformis]
MRTLDHSSLPDGVGSTTDKTFPNIASLTGLRVLRLCNNGYTSLPDGVVDNMTALVELDISGNNYGGKPIPSSIGNLPNLNQFCGFTGEIPASFEKLTKLEVFWFYLNPLLAGPLPVISDTVKCAGGDTNVCRPEGQIGNKCNIEKQCYFAPAGSDCAILQETIPTVFDRYSNCCKVDGVTCDAENRATKLLLPNKSIAGQLSVKIGGLTKLEELDLSNNAIEGPLPELFDKLTSLATLNVTNNKLTGPIPKTLAQLASLTKLDISGNTGMDGTLPGFPATLTDCKGTDTGICVPQDVILAQSCGITKDCPYTAPAGSDCAGLQQLLPLFYKDKFCCKVPGTPCNKDGRVTSIIKPGPKKTGKRDVTSIITGPFPDLGNLTYLEKIDLSNNAIEGPLPELFDKLTSFTSLNVSNNKLTGPIPKTLTQLASLTKLDISGNTGMDGTLPGFPATLTDCKGTDTGICVPAGLTGTDCGIETKLCANDH